TVPSFLQEAKTRGRLLGLSTLFLSADHLSLPFRDEKFDGVMVIGNRFGMTGDERTDFNFLRELARVLKPQGRLVAVLPHRDGFLYQFQERDWETMIDGSQILITRKWDAVTGQMWEEWRNSDVKQNFHLFVVIYRVYTLTELENLLFKAGFNLVNAFGNFMGSELTYKSRWMVVQSVKV
ncbi:MAG: methyltransferase domain-containing protein, partial [Armatimonadetes bacterium]|nr:methyltransferase domain-containing protein [Armatimonadota bacterium]